jgi:hypothetical protein
MPVMTRQALRTLPASKNRVVSGAGRQILGDMMIALLLYQLTIETSMPHLEENLRYAVTREERCLSQDELLRAFPILEHPSLEGCRLNENVLVCEGKTQQTTGYAQWRFEEKRISGTLSIQLGGKNMTFSQRITAIPLGACDGPLR